MRCPKCRTETGEFVRLEVVGVRHPEPGSVKRYRRCPSCGGRVTTMETPLVNAAPLTFAAASTTIRT
ncbi:MAG: hypothetical protein K8U57_12620 [Planctomycetes bacterium]|nr:hypothetical protein [Planctomycetota bacterium]